MPRRHKYPLHRPLASPADCSHKRRYANELAAQRAAELGMLERPGVELDVYQCPLCQGWHLTSRPNTDRPNL